MVGMRIRQMLDNHEQIFDPDAPDGHRDIKPGDIVLLERAKSINNTLVNEFASLNIPLTVHGVENYFKSTEVRTIVSLLKIIDNPYQDIPLVAVLRSPIVGLTEPEMAYLRINDRHDQYFQALERFVTTYHDLKLLDDHPYGIDLAVLHQKTARFLDQLHEFHNIAQRRSLVELIWTIYQETGYLDYVAGMPGGQQRQANLHALYKRAHGYEESSFKGLYQFIRFVERMQKRNQDLGEAPAQLASDTVNVMTIHGAKGLEFPVVFVADTDHKFNQSDAIRPVLTHSRLGVGVMLRAPRAAKRFKTLPYAALAQAIRTETLSEEMRVLYVALTRAQDALIITVPLKKTASSLKLPALCAAAEATGPEAMRSMTSWAGWILTAALLHPDSSALWEYTSFLPHYGLHRAPLGIRVLPLPEETEQPPAPPAPAADPAVVEMLKASFAWRSPREALEKVPAKVSVSAVAHATRPVALERPAFLQKTGMTGAERGTAIHAFMQSVPFDGPAPDLDAEVRRQTDLQLLDPALADKLDLDAVRPFFASAVWRRVRLAKQILREEPFITALPAAEVTPAAGQGSAAAAEVLVQGIADLVLVFDEHAEILDYKTDRSRDAQYYIDEYAAQLRLYRRAFAQRLAVPVTKLTIYSFAIEDEIDVPLA